jgi:hypothetical protein
VRRWRLPFQRPFVAPFQRVSRLPGAGLEVFNKYVELLLRAKAGGEPSVSAGGYAAVIGVSKTGKGAVTLSMDGYARASNAELAPPPPQRPGAASGTAPTWFLTHRASDDQRMG